MKKTEVQVVGVFLDLDHVLRRGIGGTRDQAVPRPEV